MTLRNSMQHHRRVNRSADQKLRPTVSQISSCLPMVLRISAKTNVSLDLSLANTGLVHFKTVEGVAASKLHCWGVWGDPERNYKILLSKIQYNYFKFFNLVPNEALY